MPTTTPTPVPRRPARDHVVKVRLSADELRAIQGSAAVRNRYLSEYMRLAALGLVKPYNVPEVEGA